LVGFSSSHTFGKIPKVEILTGRKILQAIRWCWAIKYILICSLMLTACRPQPQPPRLTAATPTTAQRPRPSISTPRLTPTSTSEPIAAATTAPTPVTHTAEILTDTILPVRDLDELAVRFKSTAKTGQAAPLQPEHHFVLDDRETFWVTDNSSGTPEQFQIDTTLVYMTDHAYWWIQTDAPPLAMRWGSGVRPGQTK
jgi:hypothetical protein